MRLAGYVSGPFGRHRKGEEIQGDNIRTEPTNIRLRLCTGFIWIFTGLTGELFCTYC